MFKKYPSLTNHYEGRFINCVIMNGLTDGLWVAREKIHGCNFSFICEDGENVTAAKRTDIIHPTEKFYGYETIHARYSDKVRELWNLLHRTQNYEDGLTIQIFGEYAGNGIQSGVDYGEKEFYVFDLMVNGLVIPDEMCSVIVRFCGFKMAPLLAWGTFDQVRALPLTFVSVVNKANYEDLSTISALSGTYAGERQYHIEEAGEDAINIAEGYVMKPSMPRYLPTGERVEIKCKTPKFSEKKNKKANAFKAPAELSEKDQETLNEFISYLNSNRVESVLSKLDTSSFTAKDFGRVSGLTAQDALEEIERNHGEFNKAFDNPTLAKKFFTKECADIVRGMWSDILHAA